MGRTKLVAVAPVMLVVVVVVTMVAGLAACGSPPESPAPRAESWDRGLLLGLSVFGTDASGKPVLQPARLAMLTFTDGSWHYRTIEDPDSNVFHKVMAFEPAVGEPGILTAGGMAAALKLWRQGAEPEVLWQADFGGKFSRMRDVEIADLDGDGAPELAVATHDQGVVAIVDQAADGTWTATELDRRPSTVVHEVEIGDLNQDGVLEIYATPSLPNKLDGTPQPGEVERFVPATGEGPTVVAALGDRHAKEILVDDVDGDGVDELYVSVEAVAGGQVEILRFDADTDPSGGIPIATINDKLCRFLTAGDVDGDGSKEMIAATHKAGIWLLRPGDDPRAPWKPTLIDADSSGFEHASILTDLDGDGIDELYVANDKGSEIDRYTWSDGVATKVAIYSYPERLNGLTWNLMPFPVTLAP